MLYTMSYNLRIQVRAAFASPCWPLSPCCRCSCLANRCSRIDSAGDVGPAAPPLTFDAHDHSLVSVTSQFQSGALPRSEVITRGDGAAYTLTSPHGPKLGERGRADDGRRVDPPLHPDLVAAAVRLERAEACLVGVVCRMVHSKVLHDIVLDQRVRGPPVEC
jgi:hypothetical protein